MQVRLIPLAPSRIRTFIVIVAAIVGPTATGLSRECIASTIAQQIYWSERPRGIVRANVDGSNATSIVPDVADELAFDGKLVVDSRTDFAYWGNTAGVHRSNSSGTTVDLFNFSERAFATGLALDHLRDHLYFVEVRSSTIYRIDLDGTNPQIIIPSDGLSTNLTRIDDLRIDPVGGKLYWSHTLQKSFERSNLDGSEREVLFKFPDYIHDFDIDPNDNKIYWSKWGYSRNGGAVLRANLDGSQQQTLISQDLWGVYGLALDVTARKMYFSDYWTSGPTNYDGTIRSANIDGTMVQTIANFGPSNQAFAIALGLPAVPEPSCLIIAVFGLICCATARCARQSW